MLKFLVEININMYRGDQERATTVGVCSHLLHGGGSVMVWTAFQDFVEIDAIMNAENIVNF